MASLLSSIAPSTHCSATTSCGGVRSSSTRPGVPPDPPPEKVTTSATLTALRLLALVGQQKVKRRPPTVSGARAGDIRMGGDNTVNELCTPRVEGVEAVRTTCVRRPAGPTRHTSLPAAMSVHRGAQQKTERLASTPCLQRTGPPK